MTGDVCVRSREALSEARCNCRHLPVYAEHVKGSLLGMSYKNVIHLCIVFVKVCM